VPFLPAGVATDYLRAQRSAPSVIVDGETKNDESSASPLLGIKQPTRCGRRTEPAYGAFLNGMYFSDAT